MRARGRWWWIASVGVAIIAGVNLLSWPRRPAIALARFAEVEGKRVAVFVIVNRSSSAMSFYHHGAGPFYSIQETSGWKTTEASEWISFSGVIPIPESLEPGKGREHAVPMTHSDGTLITTPFKVGIPFWQPPPFLLVKIAEYFGRGARPRGDVLWSEVVMP